MMSEEHSPGPQVQKLQPQEGPSAEIPAQDGSHDSGRDSPLASYPVVLSLAQVEALAGSIDGDLSEEDEATRTQILKAVTLLLVITQSYEATDLLMTITKMHRLLQKATEGLLGFLQTNQVHLPVIAAMKHMPTNSAIQQIGCQFLCLCAEKCDALYDGLIRCNFHKDLIQVIHNNITDPVIQQAGMKMFSMLLRPNTVREELQMDDREEQASRYCEEVLQLICIAIPAFRFDLEIQIAASKSLALLLADDTEMQEQFMNKSMVIILEVLKASVDVDVQIHLLNVFKILARNETYLELLKQNDLHSYLVELCRLHPGKDGLMSVSLKILSYLCEKDEVREHISSGFVEEVLVPVLSQLRTKERVQNYGLRIIHSVAHRLFSSDITEGLQHVIVHLLFIAMFTRLDSARVQISGCKIIAIMLEHKQDAQRWIGDNSTLKEEPVHNLCLGAMITFRKDETVFISACEAIYWIAADNDRLSSSLMMKNVHYAVIEGLKRFRRNCLAVETGCRALRGLCIFNDLNKNAIVMDDTFGILVDVLKRHKEVVAVQTEVIGAIACLADVDMIRYQCYIQKVHENVINSMWKFSDDETLQEICLEALAVLVAADAGADILISCGVGPCVLNAMKRFRNSVYILKKGLILLQLLACPSLLAKKAICKEISSIIYRAMEEFKGNKSLHIEAYVAIQLLAEAGTYMSELFVEEGCHEFLFEALNDAEKGSELNDVAGECFFVLCQEQNQKSKMLLAACRKGAFDVVECLMKMDADVNFEEDGVTPLYHAVCNEKEDIVKVLLKHDVRDLLAPLKKSLELELHSITGRILRQIGYDQESGNITWCTLGLETVRVDWILRSFTNPLTTDPDTESEKPYLLKLKTSEQKRQRRKLDYSKSDPLAKRSRPRLRHFSSTTSMGKISDSEDNCIMQPMSAVTTNDMPIQFKVRRNLRRSLSLETTSPASSPIPMPRRPSQLSTIQAGQSQSPDEDLPVFIMSENEVEEYKRSTLTGANVPYNPKDPRQEPRDANKIEPREVDIPWPRKRPRTPKDNQLISSSSMSSDDFQHVTCISRRKMSAPVLSSFQDIKAPHKRKSSIDSITGQVADDKTYQLLLLSLQPQRFVDISVRLVRRMKGLQLGPFFARDLEVPRETDQSDAFHIKSLLGHLILFFQKPLDGEETLSKLATERVYTFDLSDNRILTCGSLSSPSLEAYFERLEKLDFGSNSLKELPDAIFKNLPSLQILDVRCNQMEVFPLGALKCEHLTELLLSRNKNYYFHLINQISEMTLDHFNLSVKKLDISYNELTSIPSGIGNYFHKLKELILNNNHLMVLPDTPLGLKELKRLDISHNQLDCIPENCLHACSKLEILEASFNYISHLPSEAVSPMVPKLNKLKLRKNCLATKAPYFIPKFILDLPGLRYLDMSDNALTGFPAIPFWQSTLVKELIFNKNSISMLNLEGAKTWNKLEKLHVSNNYLKELPSEIGNFSSLSSLDISYNVGITTLPDGLGKCSKMWELNLDGLDLDLDRALMQRRVKDIICYLHNRLKKSKRYYRMKLMVVGYGGRGKTTLLKTLMQRNRKPRKAKDNRPTVGVEVHEWKYKRYERRFSDDIDKVWASGGKSIEYTLNAWDFAGQEDFYSTHQCYLSNRAIYLVVFDLRKGVADLSMLKVWLASIHSRAPGCPVIVVGTHKDKAFQDGTKTEEEVKKLAEKLREYKNMPGFPSIHGVFHVDATYENEDIDFLRNTIKYFVEEYRVRGKRVMGEKIPASYVQLSDLLTEEANSLQNSYPVIRHSRLMQIVKKANLDLDEEELQQAVSYLHESGILLHYKDSTLQLRDFYFIDPGWLCRMMAQVVTVKQINPFVSEDGVLRKKDVELLFRDKSSFPVSLIPQYLKLLEKFEIALPHSDTELLIPARLPLERPADIDVPQNSTRKIVRIYRMPYVPIGLWFRLISRMRTLTENTALQALLDISEPAINKCWRKGFYTYWSVDQYFLLDPIEDKTDASEGIKIVVPSSGQGSRLLGQIVDHIDNLIDEWYPGLTSIDPILGHTVLEIEVPCPYCSDFGQGCEERHNFLWQDIQVAVEKSGFIECPKHRGDVPISELAPDLVMSDLEPAFELSPDEFEFEESSDKQLGDGGYGDVYTAKYKGKEVAVKVFKQIAEIHSLTMLRQEATILRCLNHPSIVSLVAVGIRPPVILLELAPLGTLGHLVKNDKLGGRVLQQRIALQVAEGLEYLHKMMIIFRDMKPDNVLIFSVSSKALIHAKISDYGIARFSAYEGLKAQEGTLAYRAPEVTRKENYSFEADVFSYGLTMYVMLAKRHPFDQLESKGEMDRAIAEGLTLPTLESKGISEWPDMHSIIMQCLNHDPSHRPTPSKIVEIMTAPEMLSLQKMVYVSKSTTVECFAIQLETEERKISLWISSGDSNTYQLSKFCLSDTRTRSMGTNFEHGRIMCMQTLPPHYLALGTQLGRVWLYDTGANELKHSSADLQDSVLCMKYMVGQKENEIKEEGGLLLVGLANGKIAMLPVFEFIEETNVDPICLYPGGEFEPVLCMARMGKRIFSSCGAQILILNTSRGISIEKIFEVDKRSRSSAPIYNLCVTKGAVLYTRMNSPEVEIWDCVKERLRDSFSMATLFGIPKPEARVTALACPPMSNTIWVGTHSGHIGLVDLNKLEPIALTHRYVRSVRCLIHVIGFGVSKEHVLSGGLGFRDLPGQEVDKSSLCGCAALWNPNMADEARAFAEYEKKRKERQEKIKRKKS